MCFVYVIKHGAALGISGGHLTVRYPDATVESIPKNTIEGISIFAKVLMSTACIEFCLGNNIKVGFFSGSGVYKGSLSPVQYSNTERLRKQIDTSASCEFAMSIAKRIISAKINNQIVIMRRYSHSNLKGNDDVYVMNKMSKHKVPEAESINRIIGYEGIASRKYFGWIADNIEEEFKFERRSRRPATDPFNCMLNFGYSLLTKEIYGELENRYVNPYIGYIHQDKYGHPALASDLIEEWRPVIVDSTVLSLIQGHEIKRELFNVDSGMCKMTEEAIKIFIKKLEQKMETKNHYLKYIDKALTFREAVWHQADRMSRAIDKENPDIYVPVMIR